MVRSREREYATVDNVYMDKALSAFLERDSLLLDSKRAKLAKKYCKRLVVIVVECQTEKRFCDLHASHALYEKNKKILEVPFHTKYSISSTV